MNIVILDGFKESSVIENIIKENFNNSNHTYHYFKINEYDILPCSSCGSCNENTPGRCILNDDYEIIIEKIALCDSLILATPIRYGGYSSTLKKIVDRFMIIGTPFYIVKKGHMLHDMRYDIKNLITIGQIDKTLKYSGKSIEAFRLLSNRNALNMNLEVSTFVYDTVDTKLDIIESFSNFIKYETSLYTDSEVNHV